MGDSQHVSNASKVKPRRFFVMMSCVVALALQAPYLLGQHGHPLVGSWSGFLNREEGPPLRALVTMSFNVDQVISGMLIANGQRYPFTRAELDHEHWAVTINAEGQDRTGSTLSWVLTGTIENLDSPTDRTLTGTWQQGGNMGDFRIIIN